MGELGEVGELKMCLGFVIFVTRFDVSILLSYRTFVPNPPASDATFHFQASQWRVVKVSFFELRLEKVVQFRTNSTA